MLRLPVPEVRQTISAFFKAIPLYELKKELWTFLRKYGVYTIMYLSGKEKYCQLSKSANKKRKVTFEKNEDEDDEEFRNRRKEGDNLDREYFAVEEKG